MLKKSEIRMFDVNLIINKLSIKEGDLVADLGCGHFGYFVFKIAPIIGMTGLIYAVDILPPVLEDIKKQAYLENYPQVKTVWSNLEIFKGTNIESSSVDKALIVNVLSQSEKKVDIIREAVRILKRGGLLLIADWKNDALLFGPEADKRLKFEALKQAAVKLSLTTIEEFEVGENYHALLLKKI